MQQTKHNILIVEDHELTRFGLKTTFEGVEYVGTIFEAKSAEEAFIIVKENNINLVIMDLGLPEIDGIDATREIKRLNPEAKIVILTSHGEEKDVLNSIIAGANAYCSKEINLDRLINVVSSVLDGASWFDPAIASYVLTAAKNTPQMMDFLKPKPEYNLTLREKQILKLITEGYSNIEIAKKLFVSVNTTKVHVASILQKLEVDDRLQAAVKALKENIV